MLMTHEVDSTSLMTHAEPLVVSREVLSLDEQIALIRLESSGRAASQMHEAWGRPVRHNRRIEREILWHTVHLDKDCRDLLEWHKGDSFVTPPLPDPAKSYDIEAAIRTIPALIPFTQYECEAIRSSEQYRDMYFSADSYENDIPGIGITQPGLLARWHEWLWARKGEPPQRAVPNPEAEALAAGYTRLAEAMLGAVAIWRASAFRK